jgi:hypothetical protein
VDAKAALVLIRDHARAWRIIFVGHAEKRMRQRGATRDDVRAALMGGKRAVAQPEERWRVDGGRDLEGDDLTVVVVIEDDGDLVVTLF